MSDHLEVSAAVHFGKPCVAGTRIPVQDVQELVREGISFDTILADYYPDLTAEDVRACIQYVIERGVGVWEPAGGRHRGHATN